MKKIKFVALAALLAALPLNAQENDWGAADTVACHMVGPGMKYTKIIFPEKPLILWWVEVDLSNKYNKIEQVLSRHSVPDPLRWDVMTHSRENSREGHDVKVAWNHDFFSYEMGVCIGINISEGEMTWHKWGRSLLAISEDKTAEVFYPNIDCHVTAPDGTQVVIDYYNAFTGGLSGDCILYNRFNSKELTESGKYIAIEPLDKWLVNGDDIRCKVLEISDEPLQTGDGRYVLYLRNGKQTALDGHVSVGDVLAVTQRIEPAGWGTPQAKILNAFHGYPSIIHDGVLHEGEYNNFENGREYEKSSRVMVGVSKDKKTLYVATTEMSSNSLGVDCVELSQWMVAHGAWDVVNFDSGGSAAIVVDDEMLNVPGRGSVRPVEDAMLAVSLAPTDEVVNHMMFSVPYISPSTISRTPLRVMAFNQYDEVLVDDVAGCKFLCEPQELGYVDELGIFHAGTSPMAGKIYATKDGKTATLYVTTVAVTEVRPVYENLLIDNHRIYTIPITGVCKGLETTVDAGAFSWSCNPEGVVSVKDGVIQGIAEGETVLSAAFGDVTFDLNVKVEIAEGERLHEDFSDMNKLRLKTPTTVKNPIVDYNTLPDGWTSGAVLNFDLTTGRSSSITLSPELTFYSLPDSLSFRIDDRNDVVRSYAATFSDGQGGRFSATGDILVGDRAYFIPVMDKDNTIFSVERYPITLKKLTLNLENKAIEGCAIGFSELKAYYPGYTGVDLLQADQLNNLGMSIEGERLKVEFESDSAGKCSLSVYSVTGQLMASQNVDCVVGGNVATVDVKSLPVGIYMVTLWNGSKSYHGKCLIK